jgi:Fe-S-cluster formation regulator IscX/YfhJ
MKKQIAKSSQSDVDPQTLNFVKALCARITQAIEDLDDICAEEANPKP